MNPILCSQSFRYLLEFLKPGWKRVFCLLTSHSFPPWIVSQLVGLMEDALLWGTTVILFRLYASLSKADVLLKNHSPR